MCHAVRKMKTTPSSVRSVGTPFLAAGPTPSRQIYKFIGSVSGMLTAISVAIPALALALLSPQIAQAQGTIYLSNLDQSPTASLAAGSDSWLAGIFQTGTNAGGYVLNSIQLAMADASGTPGGFKVMLYAPAGGSFFPGRSLGTLNGSLDPVASGIYSYSPATILTLAPNVAYSIVLTGMTPVAAGAYEWSYAGMNSYNPTGGWSYMGTWTSSNGSSPWTASGGAFPQFAVDAAIVPEPGVLSLLLLGGYFLVRHRRKAKAVGAA
jgi:hypothetical protein